MAVDLKALAKAVPGLNKQAQQRAQAAAGVGLQQQLGAAPRQVPARAGAQQLAASQATQMGKVAAQTQAAQQQQLAQIGQMGLQQQQQQAQTGLARKGMAQQEQLQRQEIEQKDRLSEAEISNRKRMVEDSIKSAERVQQAGLDYDERLHLLSTQQVKDLNRIGQDVKSKIFDSRMTFDRDEMGRKFTNSRQLADYTISNAQTEQQARERLQLMQQQSHRKVQLLQTMYNKINVALEQEFKKSEQDKDYQLQERLAKAKAGMQKQLLDAQNEAANKQAMIGAAGTIAFAAGTYFGGPGAGAAAQAGTTAVLGSIL